jgi:hypothetical protein
MENYVFSNVTFYVRCSEVCQFLIPFLHEHESHHILKTCIQNSGAAIAQLILLKTVENDICNFMFLCNDVRVKYTRTEVQIQRFFIYNI